MSFEKYPHRLVIEVFISGRKYNAQLDTGSFLSVVTSKVLSESNLQETNKRVDFSILNTNLIQTQMYLADIELEYGVGILTDVVCSQLPQGIDVLLGLNFISKGELLITNHEMRFSIFTEG